jgi:hypothetical protein
MRPLRRLAIAVTMAAAAATVAAQDRPGGGPIEPTAAMRCAVEKTFRATAQHQGLRAGESYTLCCQAPRADGAAECVLRSSCGDGTRAIGKPEPAGGAQRPADAPAALAALRALFAAGEVRSPRRDTMEVVAAPRRGRPTESMSLNFEEIKWKWSDEQARNPSCSQPGRGGALAARPNVQGVDRPGGGPIEPNLAPAPGQGYQLTLVQQGGTIAKVPMKHGSCGLDCGTHVLAGTGNLEVPFKVGMNCPAGTTVVFLAAGATSVLNADSGKSSFSKDVELQPFAAQELEKACQTALGGSWGLPDPHNNSSPTASASLSKKIKVSGRCFGWANTIYQDFPVSLSITCTDQDF